jgi:hypothetical protein
MIFHNRQYEKYTKANGQGTKNKEECIRQEQVGY